ncbi:MAG TPA: oxygen-independent coproporphyrinogen III oxidase-like protein, partial [Methylophilaceae bacterium]|nr:oxygen-independent coproporphyrinogen III oxidase-like protein [Methylophilaceae bacterium]
QHNLNYWTFGEYLGIGAGAHSKLSFHDKIIRQSRHKHPKHYMAHAENGNAIDNEWPISSQELSFEFMMNALRLTHGFDKNLFEVRTGLPLITAQKQITLAETRGLIWQDQNTLKPTLTGRRFLNNLLDIFL